MREEGIYPVVFSLFARRFLPQCCGLLKRRPQRLP
jgi:hypothetical protein